MKRIVAAAVLTREDEGGSFHTLAIIGDRRLSVAALVALLLGNPRYRLLGEVRGIVEVQDALADAQPEVVLAETVGSFWRHTIESAQLTGRTLLLLDPEDDPGVFSEAVSARAAGYLSRTASREVLEQAIDSVRESATYLDPLLIGGILSASHEPVAPARSELSLRERDILIRIATGRSTKEIAREFAIAAKTVGNHVSNICQKLNLKHRSELVIYAVQEGLTRFEAAPPP